MWIAMVPVLFRVVWKMIVSGWMEAGFQKG
jgi:hypothetical protein